MKSQPQSAVAGIQERSWTPKLRSLTRVEEKWPPMNADKRGSALICVYLRPLVFLPSHRPFGS